MSEPIEVLLKRLTAIHRGRETAKGFHFFCQVGGAHWKHGVTTLQLSGTGWVLASWRAGEAEQEDENLYSAYISTRDLRAFVKRLMDSPFWEMDQSRWERVADETNIHLRLADTGKGFAWDVQVWSDERRKQRNLRDTLALVDLVLRTVSDGEVTLRFE